MDRALGLVEGGYLIDFNFPNFLVGRRSLDLADSTETGAGMYLCMATQADFASGQQTSYYVNSQLDILSGYYPFSESGFDRIVTELKRPEK